MLLEGLLQCACLPATTDELPVRTSARPCCHARSRSVSAMVIPGYIHCSKYVAHPHPEHWFKLLLCYADSGAPEKPLCLTLSYVCAHTLPAHCRRLESLWPLRRWQLGHLLGRRWTVLRPTSANPALLLEPAVVAVQIVPGTAASPAEAAGCSARLSGPCSWITELGYTLYPDVLAVNLAMRMQRCAACCAPAAVTVLLLRHTMHRLPGTRLCPTLGTLAHVPMVGPSAPLVTCKS